MEAKLLVLCAMLAYAAAGPVRQMFEYSDSCATTCDPSTKFNYLPGRTYTYDYMVQTETSMNDASEEKAALSISGQADIEVIEECELVLKLKNVRLHESSPSADNVGLVPSARSGELRQLLQSSPLRFSFQDGVMAELCPDRQEDPWALNIKRGLLSALQNSMATLEGSETVQEVDITGTCETQYEVTSQSYWGTTSIKRSKDLLACTNRHGYTGSLQTTRYQVDSEMQSVPLMVSEHECQQDVAKGIVQSSVCTETHLFRPFSSERSGAVTTVMQKLTFKSDATGISSSKDRVHSRAEMTFDHDFGMKDSSEARTRAEHVLSTLCDLTVKGIQPEVPRLFSQLVGAVRKLDNSDIREIHRQLKQQQICPDNNDKAKKFFLDALPMAGSSESVDLMKDLLVAGDITGLEADLWLNSLAFIPKPTAEMLDSVLELLKSDSLKLDAMLPVSSMVHTYCKDTDCSTSWSVENIMDLLEGVISKRCSVNDGNIKTVLTTLGAIGNAGQARARDVVVRCLDDRVPTEVRVAAAQAFRRMPCGINRCPMKTILEETDQDTELRIVSYLQLMSCPSQELFEELRPVFENEPADSQVGSFIYSHMTNLLETSSPLKQEVKEILKSLNLKQFDLNPLKFSRNYEKSAFLKSLNSGAQGESNVIFSAESPLPRSVSANLTVDVFGHSINLLEMGGRLEGMEYFIEAMQTYFFGTGKDKSSRKKLDELKGSVHARIFGNELLYGRFQGLKSLSSDNTFNVLDFLIKMSKDHDFSFTHSLQFLDSTMTIPTASGLPLTLSVNGTAVVDIKAKGKMDLRKVSKSPRTLHIEGEIRPSGAVNVDGVMSVDAVVTRTGLKVTSSLHSSLAVKGRVELDRGRVLSAQVDMPDDRQDILDVRTKFFILHNEAENEQKMITDNRKELELCTGSMLSKVTGLELCGQLQFPNASMQSAGPYFPLTGPSSISLVLHKRDSHSGYKLLAKRVENKRSSIAQLSFDTPGSSVQRAVSFDMMINYPQREAEISFASPWKKTAVKGSLVNEAGMKSLTASMVIDDDQTYTMTSEVKVDKDKKLTVLTPMVELRRPGADKITLMGNVQTDDNWRRYSHDLTLDGVTKRPLQFQGTLTNTQDEKGVSSTFKYGKRTYSAQAGVTYNIRSGKNVAAQFNPTIVISAPKGDILKLQGSTDYRQNKMLRSEHTLQMPDVLDMPVSFRCEITQKARRKGPKFNVDVRLKSRPFTSGITGFLVLGDTSSTNLKVDYNVYRGNRDRVTISGKLSNRSTQVLKKYTLTSSVEFKRNPDWNVEANVDLDHKKRHTGGSLEMKLGKDPKDKSKQILWSASVDRKIKSLSDMDITYRMKTVAPMMGVNYVINGEHAHSPDSLASQMTLKYNKANTVKAEINLKDKSDKQIRMIGDASLSFPGHSYAVDSTVKKNGKQYVHTMNLKTHDGPLMSATSTYRPSRDNSHEVTSNIDLEGYNPVKMSGTAGLQWDNLKLQGQLLHGKDSYSVNTLSKISRGPRGKWTAELTYPSRSLAFSAVGGLQKNSADMDLSLAWDIDRDDSAKVTLMMSGSHKNTRAVTSSSAKLDITSPFQPLKKLSASVSLDDDQKRYGLDGKFTLGGKANAYYSTLNVRKPLSPGNVQMSWNMGSPLRGWKRLQASVDHQADSTSLNTVFKATKGKSQLVLTAIGKDNSGVSNKDLTGDITLKSDLQGLEDVVVALAYKDDGRKYESSCIVTHNQDRYSAELDMSHSRYQWQLQNNGQLKIMSPTTDLTTTWQHRNSADDIKTTLTSNWGHGKLLKIDVSGDKQLTGEDKSINSAITIQSPWKLLRDLSLTLQQEMSGSHCKHQAALTLNSQKKAATVLNYQLRNGDITGDFSLTTPYTENTSGSLRANYKSFPINGHVELNKGGRKSITGDASFSKTGDLDMEGNLRVTTPLKSLRTITLSGSSQKDGQDLITKANLDYGDHQNYDAELRIRPDSLTLGRIKIHSPFTQLSALNAGYQITGNKNDFDATADLTLRPVLGKYSATLNWELDNELSGKLRVDTPLRDLQYMQVTVNSQIKNQGRSSSLEAEYYPRQTYSLTSFYTTSMPLIFSLSAETPIPDAEQFGLSFRHQHDDSSIATHGDVQYQQANILDSAFNLNWQRNVDGSLLVKTTFPGFEESKLSVRHDGEIDDFNTHVEAEFMHKSMASDAQFKYGYTTSGSLSLTSSLDNVENMEFSFRKRGPVDNMKGFTLLTYGDQKIKGTVNNRLTARVLKTSATLTTPFTKDIKSTVDLSNKQGIMQAAVSAQYGSDKIDTSSSLQIDQSDFTASSSLTYKLDGRSKEVLASISKKGDLDNLKVDASFSSPFNEDVSVSLQHTCNLPSSLKTVLSGSYGKSYTISSENSFSKDSSSITASSINSYRLGGPLREARASLTQKGDLTDMSISALAKYEDQEINMNGEWNTENGISTNLQVSTPFSRFERLSLGLTFVPTSGGFRQQSHLKYMTDQKIEQTITFSHTGLAQILLDASLTSPVLYLENTILKIRHNVNKNQKQCTGSAEVTTSMGIYGLTYNRVGDLDQMTVDATLNLDGEKMVGHMEWIPLTHGYKHSMELKAMDEVLTTSVEFQKTDETISGKALFSLPPFEVSMEGDGSIVGLIDEMNVKISVSTPNLKEVAMTSIRKSGPLDDLTLELTAGVGTAKAHALANFLKNSPSNMAGKLTVTTPFPTFETVGGFFKYSVEMNRFNTEGGITYQVGKEITGKANFYRYQWKRLEANVELSTPFVGFASTKASYRHAGSADGLTCSSSLEYGRSKKISADLSATWSPKYDITLIVKTPFNGYKKLVADATLESVANAHTAGTSLDFGRGQRYAIDGSLDMDTTPMTMSGKLTTPLENLRSVEISGSHQGQISDFSSSFSFNTPATDVIKGDAMLKYDSLLNMNAAASVTSEIPGLQDLRVELKSQGLGNSGNGHLMARWAPQQQVSLDGTYTLKDYLYSKDLQTDLTLTTPFQRLRSANIHLQHEQKDNRYSPKMELTLNGKSLLDVEGELMLSNSPSASLTSRKPWPAQITTSLTRNGPEVESELFVNWNRDENDKNVRVQTKAKNTPSDSETNVDYSAKVIHPSFTLSSGVSLVKTDTKVTSEGFLAWDDRADRKIFYNLELTDDSQYYRKMYDGKVKLGIPARVLEGSGSYSNGRQTTAVDASFSWDAERDVSKKVEFNAKMTEGQKTKMDITLNLPAISKKVHIDHQMQLNQGRTVWDGRTEVSYSPDSQKTLTVASSIMDVSDYLESGKNYTMAVSIFHPHTDTDISFTSHLGASGERYSAAMNTAYLTSRRQRKNLAVRGEIDRLRRLINVEWVSPLKKVSMIGEVKSTDPYVIKMTNTYDDQDTMEAELNVNPELRTLQLSTNYDLDNPYNTLVLKAGYVNSTALRAELSRIQDGETISEALLAMRLNTSSLLHTRLAWRPGSVTDMKNFLQRKTMDYIDSVRHNLEIVSEATGEELSAKYAAITDELSSELSPVLNLMEGELGRLGQQMDRARRMLLRMYRNNDLHMQDIGVYVLNMIEVMKEYSQAYKTTYNDILTKARDQLDQMTNYKIRQQYDWLIDHLAEQFALSMARNAERINELLADVNTQLQAWMSGGQEKWEQLKNHPKVQQVQEHLRLQGQGYKWLMKYVGNRVQQMSIPERYTSAIYGVHDVIANSLSGVMKNPQIQNAKTMANEVYQQGAWAYRYWNVEKNAQKHLESIINLIEELIKEEFHELTDKLMFMKGVKVTVFDAAEGEIQVEIPLPIALRSLQELPDLQAYIDETDNIIDQYLPSKDTVLQYYNSYAPWVSNETSPNDGDVVSELETWQPRRRGALHKKRRLVRGQ